MFKNILDLNLDKNAKNLYFYFFLIILLNFLFKILFIDYASFYYDEIISVHSASLDFGHIKHVSEWDNNPPFYYYCLSVWIKLINDSEFTVRLLSVIFSALAAGFVYILANNLFNKTSAIISSFLFLSSDILYFYSHEARAYSLALLLSLISTYYYFKLKDNYSYVFMFALGFVNFLIIYTHYISGVIIFFQVILGFIYFEKKQKLLFSYSVFLLIGLILLRFTKKQFLLIIAFNSKEKTFWLQTSNYKYLKEVMGEFLLNQYLVIPFLIIIFLCILILKINNYKSMNFEVLYFSLISLGSIIFVFVLGKITPIFLDRYLIFSIPFILILVAFSLSFIKKKIIPISFSIIVFIFLSFKINYKTPKSMDYRSAVNLIKKIKVNSDLIIVKTKDVKYLFCYYYDRNFLSQQKKDLPKGDNIIFCSNWYDVDVDVSKYKRIIVLDSFQEYNPDEKYFLNKLSQTKKIYYTTSFYKGVKISFYS
ncbi:MAG: glycosyltransferase family 39 protein [Bacteroidota bacterium]